MAQPLPFPMQNIRYRIQSVDLATYLELYDVNDEEVVLRPIKDCLGQQWMFIASESGTGGSSYKIQNVATHSLRNPRYLSITPNDSNAPNGIAVTDEDQPVVWSLKNASGQNDVYSITCKGTKRGHEIFFLVQRDGKTGHEDVKLSNDNNFSQSKKWKILDVCPSVARDRYRIRTLNGSALQIQPDTGVISLQNMKKGKYQEWDVEPLGNGKCLIKSAFEVAYLGYEGSEEGLTKVAKKNSPHFWKVESLGEYTYSISTTFVFPDHASTVLALTSGNNNKVIMKPKKVSHNHIWIFDAVDVNTEEENPPSYETKRYPEITARGYRLRNIGTSQYIYITGVPRRLHPSSSGDSFELNYPGPGSELTLKYSEAYLEHSGDIMVPGLGNDSRSKWILEQDKDPFGNLCYFICAADDSNLVLSGDTRNIDGNQTYTIATKAKGYTRQQWKFEVA
ncbi:hypothetical protein AX14_011097 [Amanita brunnescens Koide BX004]|nr:hypothetical protein AX14_011097 [Amanita brunnescens Koide BX004]